VILEGKLKKSQTEIACMLLYIKVLRVFRKILSQVPQKEGNMLFERGKTE